MERTTIRIIIGKNIRHRRVLAGLSQQALGKHLGITFQQVQKYETGANVINCEKLVELTALFGCSVDDLCNGAVEDIEHDSEHPWNPHRVHTLISHFNRIRSRAVRNQVCGMVRMIADLSSGKVEDTL